MRSLPLAVLCLTLAAPLRAQKAMDELSKNAGPSANPEKNQAPKAAPRARHFKDCVVEPARGGGQRDQDKYLSDAIEDALQKVDGCLVNYNKGEIARKIKTHYRSFEFSCYQDERGSGGVTTHDGGKASISMTMHSRLVQYSMSARVFHEMIHAVDQGSTNLAAKSGRDGKYIVSQEMHNNLGYPDPVYGCQFACYGGVGDDERKAVARYNRQLVEAGGEGSEIPLYDGKKFKCPADQPDCCKKDDPYCGELLTYAGLCDLGEPYEPKGAGEKIAAAARKRGASKCIAEQMINGCAAVDDAKQCPAKSKDPMCPIKCEILTGKDPRGGYASNVIGKMLGMGRRFADAYPDGEGLSEEDKPLFAAAKKKGMLKACLE